MSAELPIGVASAIGAMPFARAVDAVDFVVEQLPQLPSAPPLDLDANCHEVDDLDADTLAGIDAFVTRLQGRSEPVVASLTGPITLDLRLREAGYAPGAAAEIALGAVQRVGGWLLARLGSAMPEAGLLLFLDEPGLHHSMHPSFPLKPAAVERRLSEVVAHLDDLGGRVTVGLNLGARADWAMLLRTGVGALAAPLTAQLETAATEVSRFLDSGGVIGWGAVPVDEPLGASPERLWKRLSAVWCDMTQGGADPMLLRERSIIVPSGPLGAYGLSQAERAVQLAQELAVKVWHQSLGVRLSIGA
ncbi:MAG TPA: hypothetical protein VJM33_15955 [Microthrixaceae bacterium]|nr:hypothetical protein [Microthrixaceae bacterium]